MRWKGFNPRLICCIHLHKGVLLVRFFALASNEKTPLVDVLTVVDVVKLKHFVSDYSEKNWRLIEEHLKTATDASTFIPHRAFRNVRCCLDAPIILAIERN